MLTLQKCRSLLGADCKLTDAALEQLRQELYALSDVAVEAFCATRKADSCPPRESCLDAIPDPERKTAEERAAILEYEAGLKRPEAERQAFGEWVKSKRWAQNSPLKKRRKKKRP